MSNTVRDAINEMINDGAADTSKVVALSRQIIAQTNTLFGSILFNFESLANGTKLVIPKSGSMNPFLQAGARDSLRQVLNDHPNRTMKINSAYRTVAQQHVLYQLYKLTDGRLVGLAARPGRSNHEDGLALDIEEWQEWQSDLTNDNWSWQGSDDEVHYSYEIGNNAMGDLGVQAFQSLWNKFNPQDQIDVDGDFGPQTAARMDKCPVEGFSQQIFRKGDNSPAIAKIRQALINAGANIPVSNVFDDPMLNAVKDFQKQQGLSPDGVVGSKTLRELDVKLG